jgi:hypothetical protein
MRDERDEEIVEGDGDGCQPETYVTVPWAMALLVIAKHRK